MLGQRDIKLKAFYYLGDVLALNLALFAASSIKFANGIEYHATQYPALFVAFNIIWVFLVTVTRAYNVPRVERVSTRIYRILGLIALHALLIAGLWVIAKAYFYSREFLLLFYGFFTMFMLVWRTVMVYGLRVYRKLGMNHRKVIIYGYGDIADELVLFFRTHPEYGYEYKGLFDDTEHENPYYKGKFEDIADYVMANKIDEVYCCLPYVDYRNIKKLIDFGDEALVKVKLLADFRGFAGKGLELQRYDHIPVISVTASPLDDWKNKAIKRSFDIVFSLFVIIFIFSWLFPLIALLIKLESKGPVFFKQKRTGIDGREFYCYKFRSMRVNNEADEKQATKDDDRITRIGRFIRKTSIDELPQFFNVLKGEMSVIGPRPHMLKHTEEYAQKVEKFMARHFVKPGITGLAQAKGYRGETTNIRQMRNRVKLDRFYIENWSFFLDLKILALTTISILKGDENAY